MPDRRRLGEILVERGLVTEGGLERALEEQSRTGELLGRILLARGWLSDDQLAEALAEQEASEQESFELQHGLRTGPAREEGDGEPGEDESPPPDLYLVREAEGREPLFSAASFLDAADLALEAIDERDPERLEIVRSQEGRFENVWSYTRQDSAA